MRIFSSLIVLMLLGGCAAKTPSEAPDAEEGAADADSAAEESSSESASSESESSEASDEGEGEGESEGKKSEGDEGSGFSAERLLKQDGTAFLMDFSRSAEGERAEANCEKSSGGDAEKKANCVAKVNKAQKPQGFRFLRDKEKEEAWLFIRFEIKGNKPIEHNRVHAEFADDTGKKITIKTSGPDEARPAKGAVPATFEIELPDEYTLIIDEPGRGKVVYEPKLGLFDEN